MNTFTSTSENQGSEINICIPALGASIVSVGRRFRNSRQKTQNAASTPSLVCQHEPHRCMTGIEVDVDDGLSSSKAIEVQPKSNLIYMCISHF
jgi:hypothetical protein